MVNANTLILGVIAVTLAGILLFVRRLFLALNWRNKHFAEISKRQKS